MKILLVNSNPVVSRLTSLSARKESVELDEIRNISELKNNDYNIVFVDSESYSEELSTVLKNSNIGKRVLFYTQDDENKAEIFNFDILKPFLPSEVSAILRESKIEMDQAEHSPSTEERDEPQEQYIDLNELIATKKDDLVPMNLMDDKVAEIKEEVAKEEPLIKDSEENFDLALEDAFPLTAKEVTTEETAPEVDTDDNELFELDSGDKGSDGEDNDLFALDIDDTKDETQDELLDFDLESKDEIDFEADESTKILDKDEISNIKNLLNEESLTDEEISLEEIMTTSAPLLASTEVKEEKKKKKKLKQSKEKGDMSAKVLADTLGAMPIDDLRRLLQGTKIHITIEFPNEL